MRVNKTDSKPTVLVNALPLRGGGGIAFGRGLLPELARSMHDCRLLVVVPTGHGYEELCASIGADYIPLRERPFRAAWRLWFDQVGVLRIAKRANAAALFSVGGLAPVVGTIPSLLVHQNAYFTADLSDVPRLGLARRAELYVQRMLFRLGARAAAVVFTQTPIGAADLRDRVGVPPNRIVVVPSAGAPRSALQEPRGLEQVGDRLLLAVVSDYVEHKNLEYVLDVCERLDITVRRRVAFAVTLSPDAGAPGSRFLAQVKERGLGETIVNFGRLGSGEIATLYRRADALFLPTLLESFGLPYVEALSAGVPVLTSDRPFARHICGDAAAYFEPLDPGTGARLVDAFISSEAVRAQMRQRAANWASTAWPGWSEIAADYAQHLRAVITTEASL